MTQGCNTQLTLKYIIKSIILKIVASCQMDTFVFLEAPLWTYLESNVVIAHDNLYM